MNPLKMSALIPREGPLDLPDGPRLEVELGCAEAAFLIERARSEPDRLFVGVDIREKFLEPGRQAIAELGLTNIQLVPSNLIVDLDRLFLPGRVHRFHVLFPDPWFKRRHHNRRWLTAEAVTHLVDALEPRGEIFFQSDVWSVALEALALLEGCPALENLVGEWRFLRESPFEARSVRERLCREEGLPIWRMLFARRDDGDGADWD